MPLQSDRQLRINWPGNTTPVAVDGVGASALSLCGVGITNTAAAVRFVRFYDVSSSPTVGTTAPARVYEVGAALSFYADFMRGKLFKNGCWVSVTNLAADTDTTAPTAGDILLTVDWQP